MNRFYYLWEQIAEHYIGYPPEVLFSILNEPTRELGAARWILLVDRTIGIIRKTNPDRTVLVATPNAGQAWSIGMLELPRNEWNVIVEIH